ncbi:MAG: type II toxin-antitoxin system antitoxin SocA domain-containing protein [Pseudomonadota bacterium]
MSNNPPRRVVYKPSWVANSFLVRAKNEGVKDVDPLKIQKLVYNLHGWNLAVTGSPVIGERFEAWPHGPVNASLYHQFKGFRFQPITGFARDIDPVTGASSATHVNPTDAAFYDIFDRVWARYKAFSGQELSDMTHAVGTPWSYARENGLQYIPDNMIRDHFIEISRTSA